MLLLATTKSGRELLIRTAQLALLTEADEQGSEESDVQEEVHGEPVEEADVEQDQKWTPTVTTSLRSQT
jgi:hypothetical protein